VILILALVPALVATEAGACGDKFLVTGSAVQRNQLHAAVHPSSILIYRNPASELAKSVLDSDLEFELEMAGHNVKSVGNADDLLKAIRSGEFQVIMADMDDAASIGDTALAFVPVASDERVAYASASYDTVVSSSSPPEQILASIDAVLGVAGGE
jgi:hypothetical protein